MKTGSVECRPDTQSSLFLDFIILWTSLLPFFNNPLFILLPIFTSQCPQHMQFVQHPVRREFFFHFFLNLLKGSAGYSHLLGKLQIVKIFYFFHCISPHSSCGEIISISLNPSNTFTEFTNFLVLTLTKCSKFQETK